MCLDCRKAEGQDTVGVCTVVLGLYKTVQIPVDSVYPVIHCGCFVVPDKIVLKAEQMIDCQVIVQGMIRLVVFSSSNRE